MRQLKADPKMVADQLGHSVDVSLNVYAQSQAALCWSTNWRMCCYNNAHVAFGSIGEVAMD